MRLAIFARTYSCATLEEILDAITNDGIRAVHFNLKCAETASLPLAVDMALCQRVRMAFEKRGIEMIGISGTFNAIHPEPAKRAAGIERCQTLINSATSLGTNLISLCTGTRDTTNMWKAHLDNNTPEAWRDLIGTFEQLMPLAESNGVTLGVEPECANVINTATKARKLLNELKSPYVKIILDGANLFEAGETRNMSNRLAEAFELLGPDIVQIHAKDIPKEGAASNQAAGTGCLDWDTYFHQITQIGYQGPIVMHNLNPDQVNESRKFIQGYI